MGITGLLPFMEKASSKCSIKDFSGCTVAVDTYCWLHKGAFSCADKIVRGEPTDAHIRYCMKYVNMLLSHSIKPILVFDGRHLPAKAMTETKRRESRNLAKKRAAELLRLGQVDEARSHMRRGVDITHDMALQLIKECRSRNVDCIVAPYEADAQMAYLNKIQVAQLVITEDSDLILFGCEKILFKLDLNGNGVLVESAKLPLVMKCPMERFSFPKFRQMCIMSGCDYLASLPGIGLAKARQFINATQDPDIHSALRRLPSYFNKSQMVVSDEYRDNFLMAEATFKHQLVYDPLKRKLVPLIDLEDENTDPKYCSNAGAELEPEIAFQLALGNLDPFSLKTMDDWHPDEVDSKPKGGKTNAWNASAIAPHKSIWSKDFMEHLKTVKPKVKEENVTAFMKPTTRPLSVTLVSKPKENPDSGLTMEELSALYCKEPLVKKPRTIVLESQAWDLPEMVEKKKITKKPSTQKPNVIVLESQGFDFPETSARMPDLDPCHIASSNASLSSKKRQLNSPERNQETTPDEKVSPILRSCNRTYKKITRSSSFSKLMQLSKFKRTDLEQGDKVESRFFSSSEPTSSTVESCEESGLNVSGIAKLRVEDCDEISEHVEINNRRITSESFDFPATTIREATVSPESNVKSKNPFKKISPEKVVFMEDSCIPNTYPLEGLITPEASQESISDLKNEKNKITSIKMEQSTNSSPSLISRTYNKTSVKSIKESCRRPGLVRKKSAPCLPSGQQTLLGNFGFQKKSQLKH